MSKKSKIIRSIISIVILLLSTFLISLLAKVIYQIKHVEYRELVILGLIPFFIYAIPVILIVLIYQIVMIAKRKVFLFELIANLIFILSWVSLILIPIIIV
jgi:hypothetical protein